MPSRSPEPAAADPVPVDLLIVGALTIDRFADGTTAPGGSVLHGARAASASGYAIGAVTVAGSEPEAAAGLEELGRLAHVHAERAENTVRFGHRDTPHGRELVVEQAPPTLACPKRAFVPAAVLYAPVANEFGTALGGQRHDGAWRAAILQGWLRTLEPGRRVQPLPLTALADGLIELLAGFDALIASVEDLLAVATGPAAQLDALRRRMGAGPLIVLTDGAAGAWLDDPGGRRLQRPPVHLEARRTTGAGDAFAAVLAAELTRGTPPATAAEKACGAVARMLGGA